MGLGPCQSGLRPSSPLQLWDAEKLLNPWVLVPIPVQWRCLHSAPSPSRVAGRRPHVRSCLPAAGGSYALLRDDRACLADCAQKYVCRKGRAPEETTEPAYVPGGAGAYRLSPVFRLLRLRSRGPACCEEAPGGTLGA